MRMQDGTSEAQLSHVLVARVANIVFYSVHEQCWSCIHYYANGHDTKRVLHGVAVAERVVYVAAQVRTHLLLLCACASR